MARPAGDGSLVGRIGRVVVDRTVLRGLVGQVVAVDRVAEVRRIVEADTRRQRVAQVLQRRFRMAREIVHAVHLGRGAHVEVVAVEVVETVGRVPPLVILRLGVVGAAHVAEGPQRVVVEARRYVDVVEQVERRRYGDRMGDARVQFVEQVAVQRGKLVFLGRQVGVERGGVGEGDLLIPALLADGVFAAEGVEFVRVEADGRCQRDGRVARIDRTGQRGREVDGQSRPVAGIADGGSRRGGDDVVDVIRHVLAVAAGGEVHRSREGGSGIGLRVLRVAPEQLHARRIDVVGIPLLADDGLGVGSRDAAVVAVALGVAALGAQLPRAVGVEASGQLQVDVVVDGPVVAGVAQVETAGTLLAVAGDDDTRTASLREGEEGLRYADRQRHVLHDHVGPARDDLLLRDHLGLVQGEVEVGVVGLVAGGVFAVHDVDRVVGHLLDIPTQ